MPVGKVFDATQNQVLFSPVSNFYQGKAIRQQLAAGEQDAELKDLQIKVAKHQLSPEAMRAAGEAAKLEADKMRSEIAKNAAATDAKILETRKDAYGPIFSEVGRAVQAGETVDAVAVTEQLGIAAKSINPQEYENFMAVADTNQDGILDERELAMAAAVYSVEQEEYTTLADGAQLRGPNGELIAENPKDFSPSGDVNPFSKINPKDYTPESIARFQESGDFSDLEAVKDSGSLTNRDKKIRDYQSTLGLGPAEAIKLADGLFSVKPNPVSGTVQLIDEVGQVVREIEVDRPPVPIPSPRKGETLLDLLQYATGPINTVAAAVSVPLAWANLPIADKVVSARQVFSTTNQDFIRALQNNKRYPIGERKAITEEISMIPKFLDDPRLMRVRMIALRNTLELRADQAQRDADDPTNTAQFRGGAKQAVSDIRNYLAILGEPTAPDAAIDLLMSDPSEQAKKEFKDYFGYLPEELNEQ